MARWFGKGPPAPQQTSILSAREIVSLTGGLYADLNDSGLRFKPTSLLPASVGVVKQAFKDAYRLESIFLTEELQCSYQHVYSELAFFLEDEICALIQPTVDHLVSRVHSTRYPSASKAELKAVADVHLFNFLYSKTTIEVCQERLANAAGAPGAGLSLLVKTCHYCSQTRILLWDEWAAYANFVNGVSNQVDRNGKSSTSLNSNSPRPPSG